MPIQHVENQYVVPRGRMYWNPLVNGEYQGEISFGNVPETAVNISASKAEHFSSETAETAKDRDRVTRVNRSGKTKVDNISNSNLQNWLGADVKIVTVSATPVADKKLRVNTGRLYQLGMTDDNPLGIKNIT